MPHPVCPLRRPARYLRTFMPPALFNPLKLRDLTNAFPSATPISRSSILLRDKKAQSIVAIKQQQTN